MSQAQSLATDQPCTPLWKKRRSHCKRGSSQQNLKPFQFPHIKRLRSDYSREPFRCPAPCFSHHCLGLLATFFSFAIFCNKNSLPRQQLQSTHHLFQWHLNHNAPKWFVLLMRQNSLKPDGVVFFRAMSNGRFQMFSNPTRVAEGNRRFQDVVQVKMVCGIQMDIF